MRACLRACVRACVRARVSACVSACVRGSPDSSMSICARKVDYLETTRQENNTFRYLIWSVSKPEKSPLFSVIFLFYANNQVQNGTTNNSKLVVLQKL